MVSSKEINQKNIWVAAGDGDIPRVMELISEGLSPNVRDDNTYTPMHAAASYGHTDVLEYLISQGGDVNITDSDEETPLFVVESVEVAKFLIERGATASWKNSDGMTAADNLDEEFPQVANYLRSLDGNVQDREGTFSSENQPTQQAPSQHYTNVTSERMTRELLEKVAEVIDTANREGRADGPSEDELRRVVEGQLMEAVRMGQSISDQMDNGDDGANTSRSTTEECGPKRVKRG